MRHQPGDFKSHYLFTPTKLNDHFIWAERLWNGCSEHFLLVLMGGSFAGQWFMHEHKGRL